MIELNCPKCVHHLRIQDQYAGKNGKCRYCKTRFIVPKKTVKTPLGLKALPTPELPPVTEHDPLPGVATLSEYEESAIADSIFEKSPESTATRAAFDSHFESVKNEDRSTPTVPFCICAILLPLIALLWAFMMPRDHEARRRCIALSITLAIIHALATITLFLLFQ